MNLDDVTKKYIALLEEKIENLCARIVELEENATSRLPSARLFPSGTIQIPDVRYTGTRDGCIHEYPAVWHATVPPPCRRCGKPQEHYAVTNTGTFSFRSDDC